MEPPSGRTAPRYDNFDLFNVADEIVDLSGDDPAPRLLTDLLVEFAAPVAPPDIDSSQLTVVKRSNSSADLSADVELSMASSLRDSKSVDTILQLLRENSFAQAIEIYHTLTLRHFKDTAFNVITSKLFESLQYSTHINELLKDMPLDKKDEKMFNMASDHLDRTRTFIRAAHQKTAVESMDDFNRVYNNTKPLINSGIENTVNIYKILTHDSLRCALIMRMYVTIFLFPPLPIRKFPLEAVMASGTLKIEELKEARKNFQTMINQIVNQCNQFIQETTSTAKRKIEFDLLRFHLEKSSATSLISFFKHTCESTIRPSLLMFAADQLIKNAKIDHLPSILEAVVEVKDQYSLEDQPKVEAMIVQAIVLAAKNNRIDLAEQFFTLVPHRRQEIINIIAQL